MKKILAIGALTVGLGIGSVAVLTPACNGSQFPSQGTIQQIQNFESTVQIGLNAAQVTWSFVQPYLPPATAQQINTAFESGVATANHALSILNDAVTAALASSGSTPNFTTLEQAVTDAFNQVLAIIAQYVVQSTTTSDAGTPPPPSPATAGKAPANLPGYADAQHAAVQLQTFMH